MFPKLIHLVIVAASVSAFAETEHQKAVTAAIEEYNNGIRELIPQIAKAATDAERIAIRSKAPRPEQFAGRIMKLAEEKPDDPGAVKALCWLATQAGSTPEAVKALELLGSKHAGSAGVWEAAQQMYRMPRAQAEPILRAIIKANPNAEDKCAALHALGTILFNDSNSVPTPAAKAALEEAKQLFQEVIASYSHVSIQGFKPADQCAATLFELENLAIGCTAPEIEGKDAGGQPLKLSETRGRHVLLIFWGAWCHSCHHFLPQIRDLHEKLKDQPFTVVGVNSDPLPELQQFLKAESVPWRNFADESSTGPISSIWNIRNWPTLILLDDQGVIVAKNPAVSQVEEMVRAKTGKVAAAR